MNMEIFALGGYGVVGRNMTAVKVGDEVVILDMGIHLPNYIKINEDQETLKSSLTRKHLIQEKVVPDDSLIEDIRKQVIAIIPTHAHLDHIGAIPYMAGRYNAPIVCTPFAGEVIKAILKDDGIKIPNPIKTLNPGASMKLSKNITVEFIPITHSTPQTVIIILKTPAGNLLYSNDFKLDNSPTLGRKPDYERLKELGEQGIKVAIIDSLYASTKAKTPSEMVARDMLADVLLNMDTKGKGIIVTTFASHIARLKSIIEMGEKLNRKIVFIGRSLAKYCYAAENAGIYKFSDKVEMTKFSKRVKQFFGKISKEGKHKYLLVVTGHQGEPQSTLSKMVRGVHDFPFDANDHVVFSSNVIPSPINLKNRQDLEDQLRARAVRLFTDVHVSGHGSREDMRELVNLIKPQHVIPSHSPPERIQSYIELAEEQGYKNGFTVHGMMEGQRLIID